VSPELLPAGSPVLLERFWAFRESVYRLETMQTYRNSGEDEALAAFVAGATSHPADPTADEWADMIRGNVRAGRLVQRVHVVCEPLTDYLRFELTWSYGRNVRAGEDVRIIPVAEGASWPAGIPPIGTDYWLFDSLDLFHQHYRTDGWWLGTEHVIDEQGLANARTWRNAALELGIPWREYLNRHPDLARYLPPGALEP